MNEAQMHPYRVLCNKSLIASFQTEREQLAFINARKAKWPQNEYAAVSPRTTEV